MCPSMEIVKYCIIISQYFMQCVLEFNKCTASEFWFPECSQNVPKTCIYNVSFNQESFIYEKIMFFFRTKERSTNVPRMFPQLLYSDIIYPAVHHILSVENEYIVGNTLRSGIEQSRRRGRRLIIR